MKKLILTILIFKSIFLFAKDDRPNIIFLLADDQTQFSTGVYGNSQVKTPNLDKLANDGIIFKNSYATTAICMASRACIMTGMYEYKTGCNFYKHPLTKDKFTKSYPVLLRESGYFTGFAGKFGFDVADSLEEVQAKVGKTKVKGKVKPNLQGVVCLPKNEFDWFYGIEGQTSYKTKENKGYEKYAKDYPHSTRSYGAACCDFIKEAVASGKPFCLSMSFKAPHTPNTPDAFFNSIYEGVQWQKPENYGKENAQHLSKQARLGTQYLATVDDFLPKAYNKTMRQYHQLIYGIDYAIGMIMEELKKQGVADNTIIIFTSDNGYNVGAHAFGHKALAYEEASKIPLIIYDPRAEKGETIWRKALVANIDFAPTILDFAGVEIPDNMDGISLRGVLKDSSLRIRETLPLMQHIECFTGISMAVVSENYKYIYYPYAEKIQAGQELYDLKNDRFELNNLIDNPEYASVLEEMKEQYRLQWKSYNDFNVKRSTYSQLANMFNQDMSWQEKKESIPPSMTNFPNFIEGTLNYSRLLDRRGYKGDIYDYDKVLKFIESKY